ncbi:MAG: methylated-DNA--[protein]-cysteine S-methyltransferase [Emcibacter sp.]|nr:methylated-DNA--[protein]-cysteine S-methyltransferase [Emcibacter sp.]
MNGFNENSPLSVLMTEIALYIEDHADESLSLSILSKKFGQSASHLQKSFKRHHGVSPKEYQNAIRLKRLKSALKAADDISGAIYEAGYGSVSRVYEQVDGRIGMTLSAYREGGKGEKIAYAIRNTALGLIIMAATDRGVCFIHFGEDEEELLDKLSIEYPQAQIIASSATDTPELALWSEALNHHLSHNAPRPDIPLHLNGTAFQMRVWRFLMSVPEGDVKSYSEVAQGIGSPKAIRAAASAIASNNIAVLIPCHRVLRSDGALGGYRWGLERKRTLIDQEHKIV